MSLCVVRDVVSHAGAQNDHPAVFQFRVQFTSIAQQQVTFVAPVIGTVAGGILHHADANVAKLTGAPYRLPSFARVIHAGDALPSVTTATPMSQVIYEMSRKKLGVTTVLDAEGSLLGLISDGDLRRLLESRGPQALTLNAGDAMNPKPYTIAAEELAARGLAIMEERRITSLVVTDNDRRALGILHLHDLWGLELI